MKMDLALSFRSLWQQLGVMARQAPRAPLRGYSARSHTPLGQRGGSLSPAERRAICLGVYRPKLRPRGMPAPGRLFKGHRP